MSFVDIRLESYLKSLDESSDYKTKLKYFKRANKRIEKLKSEYNDIKIKLSNKTGEIDIDNQEMPIESMLTDLNKRIDKMEKSDNMSDTIENYQKIIKLISKIDKLSDHMRNEINLVKESGNEITIEKINLADII